MFPISCMKGYMLSLGLGSPNIKRFINRNWERGSPGGGDYLPKIVESNRTADVSVTDCAVLYNLCNNLVFESGLIREL